jgi:UDP-N-acetylglucosamine 2-epimerase (non-hydrolysing)
MIQLTIVAGARPNFMKIAPIIHAIDVQNQQHELIRYRLVHTGQHYDKKMSGDFFEQLGIPEPDANLGGGGGSQAEQTAAIMVAFEKELLSNRPDMVLVVGDVTSTLACSITTKKLGIAVAHVEGGIRSGDMEMPEEINRIVTDSISDYFFTTTKEADSNLIHSGVSKERIFLVGNTMIDTLLANRLKFTAPEGEPFDRLQRDKYFVLTLHRPSNVDQVDQLKEIVSEILDNSAGIPVIFPVHPRTAKTLSNTNLEYPNLFLTGPLPYLQFNYLVANAKGVITDSGGITEEASVLDVPCITLRNSTERTETITLGTNELVGTDPKKLKPHLAKIHAGDWKKYQGIPHWDGKAAERIVKHLVALYANE